MAITVEQAQKELGEVEAKLQDLERLHQRRDALRHFVALGEQLSSPDGASTPVAPQTPPIARVFPRKAQTAQVAYKILRAHKKLHMNDLLNKVREAGWAGSGNDTTDKNRLYIAMHRLPKVFQRLGSGQWSAREEVKADS